MEASNARSLKHYLTHPSEAWKTFRMWQQSRQCTLPIIFVVGAPRSGTTLVQTILAAHSNCVSLTEETGIFSPKSMYEYARFADTMDEETFRQVTASSSSIVDFFEKFHLAVLGDVIYQPGMRLVEKTPQHVRKIAFLVRHFPNARFLHVVRDPRDCYLSGQKAGNIYQAHQAKKYAHYWKRCVSARLNCRSDRIFDLRYETLTAKPLETVRAAMAFLELPFQESQLDPHQLGKDDRAKRGPFARLGKDIDTSTVGRWKSELSPADAMAFRPLYHLMSRFGYEQG